MKPYPHERFSRRLTLTAELVGRFAHAAGDDNPLHHDAEYARGTRFGRLIASGTHTTALIMGLTASHYSKRCAMVGMEYTIRFLKPIYADETIELEWLVRRVRPNAKLRGDIVDLRGRIRNQAQQTALGAKGRILVTEAL